MAPHNTLYRIKTNILNLSSSLSIFYFIFIFISSLSLFVPHYFLGKTLFLFPTLFFLLSYKTKTPPRILAIFLASQRSADEERPPSPFSLPSAWAQLITNKGRERERKGEKQRQKFNIANFCFFFLLINTTRSHPSSLPILPRGQTHNTSPQTETRGQARHNN